MKKILLGLCILFSTFNGFSQVSDIDSFYLPGSKWIEQTGYCMQGSPWQCKRGYSSLTITHDSMINGMNYHLVSGKDLYNKTCEGPSITTLINVEYPTFGGIRVDGRKVYFMRFYTVPASALNVNGDTWQRMVNDHSTTGAEVLLYDFNLQVGDTMPVKGMPVTSISAVPLNNSVANYYAFDQLSTDPSDNDYWIEGVGSRRGLFASLMHHAYWSCYSLACYNGGGEGWNTNGHCNEILSTGIESLSAQTSTVFYPIPLQGDCLQFKGGRLMSTIVLTDISGKICGHYNISPTQNSINISLTPGLYFIKMQYKDGGVETQKLVKY